MESKDHELINYKLQEQDKKFTVLEGKIDKILLVVTDIHSDRAVMKDNIKNLEAIDAADRLTKIETSRSTMSKVIFGMFTLFGGVLGIMKYFKI